MLIEDLRTKAMLHCRPLVNLTSLSVYNATLASLYEASAGPLGAVFKYLVRLGLLC